MKGYAQVTQQRIDSVGLRFSGRDSEYELRKWSCGISIVRKDIGHRSVSQSALPWSGVGR